MKNRIIALATAFLIMSSSTVSAASVEGLRDNKIDSSKMMRMSRRVGSDRSAKTSTERISGWSNYKVKVAVSADNNFNWSVLKDSKLKLKLKYIYDGVSKDATGSGATSWEIASSSLSTNREVEISLPKDLTDLNSVNLVADFEDPYDTNYDPDVPVIVEESTGISENNVITKKVKLINTPVTKMNLKYTGLYGNDLTDNEIRKNIPSDLYIKFLQDGTENIKLPLKQGNFAPIKENDNKFVLDKYAAKDDKNLKLSLGFLRSGSIEPARLNTITTDVDGKGFMLKTDLSKSVKDLAQNGNINLEIAAVPEIAEVPLDGDNPKPKPSSDYVRLTFDANGKTQDKTETKISGKFSNEEYKDKTKLYLDVKKNTEWRKVRNFLEAYSVVGDNNEEFVNWKLANTNLNICVMPSEDEGEGEGEQVIPNCKTDSFNDNDTITEDKSFYALYKYKDDIIEKEDGVDPGEGYGLLNLDPNGGKFVRNNKDEETEIHSFYIKKDKEVKIDDILKKFSLTIKKDKEQVSGWFTKAVNPLAADKVDKVTLTDTDKNKTLYASYNQNTLTAQDITVYKGEKIDWKKGIKDLPSNVEKVEEVIENGKSATTSNTAGDFTTKLKVTFKDGSSIVVDNVKLIVKSKDVTISFDGANAKDDANAPRHNDEVVKGKVTTTDTKVTLTDSEVAIKDSKGNVIGITKVKADGTFSAGTSRPLKAGEKIKVEVKLPGAESASTPAEKQVKLNPDKLNEILPTAEKVLANFKDKQGVDKAKYQALVDAVNGNTKNKVTGGYDLVDKAGKNENQSDKKPKSTVTVNEQGQKSLDEAYAKIKKAIEDLTANSLPVFEGPTDVTIYKTEELNLDNLVKVTDKDNDIVKQNNKDFTYKVYKIGKSSETEVTDTSKLNETVGEYKIVYMAKDKSAEVNYTVKLHVKDTFVTKIKVTDPTKMEYPITSGDSAKFEIAGMKVELIDNLGKTKETIESNDFATKGITLQIENRSSGAEKTKALANETALKVEDDVQKIIVTYTQGTGKEQQKFTSETTKILRVFPDKDNDGKDDRKADFDSTKIENLKVITEPQLEYVAKDEKDTEKLKLNLDGMVIQLTDKAGKTKLVVFKKNADNNNGKFYEYDSNNQTEFTGLTLSKNHGTALTPQTSDTVKGDSGSKIKISTADNKYTETKELKVYYDANGDGVPDYKENQKTLPPIVKSSLNVNENKSVVTKVVGKAQPGAAITVKSSDGKATLGTGAADANGDFTITLNAKQKAGVEVKVSAKLGTLKESDPTTSTVLDDLNGDGKPDIKAAPNKPVISEIREKDKNITVKAPAASEEIKKIVVSDGTNTVTLIKDDTDTNGKTWKVDGSNPEVKVTEGKDGNLVIPVENKLPLNDRDEITVTFKYGENSGKEVFDKKSVLKSSQKPTVYPVYTGEENIKVLDPTLQDPNAKTIKVVVNNNKTIIVEKKNGSWSVKNNPGATVEVNDGKVIIPLGQAANQNDTIKVTTTNDSNKESAQSEVKVINRTQTTKPTISKAEKDTNSVSGTAEKGSTVTVTITKRDNTVKTYQGTVGKDGQFNVTTDVLNDGDKIIVTASVEGKADNTSDETVIGVDTSKLGSSIEKAKEIAGDNNQNLDENKQIDKALKEALTNGEEVKGKGDKKDANTTQKDVDKAKEELDKAVAQKEADKAVETAKEKVLDTNSTEDGKNNAINEAQEKIDQVPGSIKEEDNDYNSIKKDLQDKLDLIKAIKDGEERLQKDDITGKNNKTKKPEGLVNTLQEKVNEGKKALNDNNANNVKKEDKTKDIRDALDKINEDSIKILIYDIYSNSNTIRVKTYPAGAHVTIKKKEAVLGEGYTDDYGEFTLVDNNLELKIRDKITVHAEYNGIKGINSYRITQ